MPWYVGIYHLKTRTPKSYIRRSSRLITKCLLSYPSMPRIWSITSWTRIQHKGMVLKTFEITLGMLFTTISHLILHLSTWVRNQFRSMPKSWACLSMTTILTQLKPNKRLSEIDSTILPLHTTCFLKERNVQACSASSTTKMSRSYCGGERRAHHPPQHPKQTLLAKPQMLDHQPLSRHSSHLSRLNRVLDKARQ